jgi:hypothetical protein
MQLCVYISNLPFLIKQPILVPRKINYCVTGPSNLSILVAFVKNNNLVKTQWWQLVRIREPWSVSKLQVLVFLLCSNSRFPSLANSCNTHLCLAFAH